MPDLSNEAVHAYWYEHDDPAIYKVIASMENVEDWSLDGDSELEQALEKFSAILDNIGYVDLKNEDKIIKLAVSIKMGRMLRLLQCFDIAYPGAVAKLLMFAKENSKSADDDFAIFTRRNVVFERLCTLSRVFASNRLTTVQEALGANSHG